MGYFVKYAVNLKIKPKNFRKALDILNHLHSDEMLLKHAIGGRYPMGSPPGPVSESKWYVYVTNPEKPYASLVEAFENWPLVQHEESMYIDESGCFVVSGVYRDKIGQQEFLIEQLAPVLCDTTIVVRGEDGDVFYWIVKNHKFSYEGSSNSDDEDGFVDSAENVKLALG